MFYVPHMIWKNWEEGKIRMISEGMRGSIIGAREERQERQSRLVQYLVETMHMHNTYAFGYFVAEALNFVNVVSMIVILSKFTIIVVNFDIKCQLSNVNCQNS